MDSRHDSQGGKMRLVLLFAAVAGTACPQILSVGVKGGGPLTDAIDAASNQSVRYISNTKRYLVGPTVELNLPLHVSIEFDALYRRENYESRTNLIDGFSTGATTANSWEFPLLLKWRFSGGPIRPFVDAGFSFDKLSDIHQLTRTFIAPNLNTSTTT